MLVAGVPEVLRIRRTGELRRGQEYLALYSGIWVHAPLPRNPHVFEQKDKVGDNSAEVLYWQDDKRHWQTGPRAAADPKSKVFGTGTASFVVPFGPAHRYSSSYEANGFTFTWNPPDREVIEAEQEMAKAKQDEIKEMETEIATQIKALEVEIASEIKTLEGELHKPFKSGFFDNDDRDSPSPSRVIAEGTYALNLKEVDDSRFSFPSKPPPRMPGAKSARGKQQQVLKQFQSWDTDGNGTIDSSELAQIFKMLDATFDSSEINTMLKTADRNRNGTIDYQEFIKWVFGDDTR